MRLFFYSGTGIDLKKIGYALKHQGVLLLVKFAVGVGLSLLYISIFGLPGVFGINALAFTIVISSINPAVYLSLMQQYRTEQDTAVYGIIGLFSIVAVPMIVFGISSRGDMDWTPVLSTLILMAAGIAFGNIDPNFRSLFMPALPGLMMLMGWNLGYGMNVIEAFQAGVAGIIVTIVIYIVSVIFVVIDRNVLGNDGSVGAPFMTVAGLLVSTAGILGSIYPEVFGE